MFFGQEVKSNQNKAGTVTLETDVKLSQAVLDPATKGNKKEPVCLMAEIQGKSFILAVLDPAQSWQCPLDLMLAAGTEVKFYLRGQGQVHLTGYEFRDDADDFELSMSSDDEMEDEEEEEAQSRHAAKKIKTKNSPAKTNGVKPSNHLAKMNQSGDNQDSDDDDDDDDSDDEDLSFGSEDEIDLDNSDDSMDGSGDVPAVSSSDDDDDEDFDGDEEDDDGEDDDDDDDDDDESD